MHRLPLVRRRTPPSTCESPIGWPAGEALTGALGALNPEFNGDLSDHFGSDSAKKGIHRDPLVVGRRPVFFLARLLAFCSSPGGLPLLPGPPGTRFHSPLMLIHGSNLTVCSQGPWPLSHRIHWYFSRAPSGQDPHRRTPQEALDRSRSFLASQDFGIPAVFIPRQVLTVRIPRTPLVLKSPMEFPCSRLGSPARSSPVHSCGTLSSPTRSSRRPGQDILHECFMGPVQPGFQAQRVPRCLSGSRLAQKIRSQVSLVSLDNGA